MTTLPLSHISVLDLTAHRAGPTAVRQLADGWTIVTADGSLSAQFEHTVLVTRDGCEILTPLPVA